ncbi:MAG: orotidine-5'-phosphate decarboxylase [Clostridia bacterium]|nr:orotidine-5'-phosphate decarboxylase [Clostridia bacterium]
MFADRLIYRINDMNNPTVLGLDPQIEFVPDSIRRKNPSDALAISEFNRKLLFTLHDIVPAVKFQSAYYEMLGPEGAVVLKESIQFAKSLGMIVILDGKRNDIGSTARAYARAYLSPDGYDADALTVNAYLGTDGIQPFLELCEKYEKGIFILVKTSNPSSGEFQDLRLDSGERIYERMADMVKGWGTSLVGEYGYSSVGAVVGATYPDELKALRERMKKTPFLIPGYGAQGGAAADVMHGFDEKGNGSIVNSSRGLMCAWKNERYKNRFLQEDFCEAARHEAVEMRNALSAAIGR